MTEEVKTEFTWTELSEEARQHAKQTHFDPDGDWHECVIDQFKEDMAELNVKVEKTYYSGFWSQGDGASWTGKVDLQAYLCRTYPDDLKRMVLLQAIEEEHMGPNVTITQEGHHYVHDMTMAAATAVYGWDETRFCEPSIFQGSLVVDRLHALGWDEGRVEELEKEVLEWARSKARELYENLEAEYEKQLSDEYLADLCEANEYVFDEDGNLN